MEHSAPDPMVPGELYTGRAALLSHFTARFNAKANVKNAWS